MGNSSSLKKATRRDAAYYRQRQKNHVFSALVGFFQDEAQRRDITKKDWAEAMGKDPAQCTRWLTSPSNLELDTISDMLLPFEAEMEHRIVRFSEKPRRNSAHHLMRSTDAGAIVKSKSPTTTSESRSVSGTKAQPSIKVEVKLVVSGV